MIIKNLVLIILSFTSILLFSGCIYLQRQSKNYFLLNNKNQQAIESLQDQLSDENGKLRVLQNSFNHSLDQLIFYKKTSPTVDYQCFQESFKENNFPENIRINLIKDKLKKEGKGLVHVCIHKNDFIVISGQLDKNYPSYTDTEAGTLEGYIYNFLENNEYNIGYLFQQSGDQKNSILKFKLTDWLENGDFIYTLFDNLYNLRAITYVGNINDVNLDNISNKKIVEYCKYGIGKGTSIRSFFYCRSTNEDKESKYIKQEDLP